MSKNEGWITFDYVFKDDFVRIRDIILEMHKDINSEILKFNEHHSDRPIPVDSYTYRPYDKNTQLFKYKNTPFVIPNVILDDVIKLIDRRDFSPGQLRKKIGKKIQQYEEASQNQSIAFNDPLNRTSMIPTLKLSNRNTSLYTPKLNRSTRPKVNKHLLTTIKSSTPLTKRQRSITDSYQIVKNPSKWAKI